MSGPPLPPPPPPPLSNNQSISNANSSNLPPPPGSKGSNPSMTTRRIAIPTKPQLKPSRPVRSLMWSRIILKPDSLKGSFWKKVHQLENIDYEQLESIFATKSSVPVVPVRKSNINNPNNATKANLDQKKLQALEIFFRSQNLSFSQLKYIIDNMLVDESIGLIISTINDNYLTTKEFQTIDNYLKSNNCDADSLLKSEAIMYKLYLLNGSRPSIKFLHFISSKQFILDSTLNQVRLLEEFLIDIRDNPVIKKLLSIILSFGNFLNGNHPKRCQADGFQLQILAELKYFKVTSSNNSFSSLNILEVAIKEYLAKFVDNPSSLYLSPPYVAPSKIASLKSFSFSKTQSQIEQLRSEFEEQTAEMHELINKSTFQQSAVRRINESLNDFDTKIKLCKKYLDSNLLIAKKLIKDFGDVTIERDSDPEEKLLEIWIDFYNDFDSVFMKITTDLFNKFFKEMEARLSEHRKKAKNNVKIRQSLDKSSLKNRLKRMSYSVENISNLQNP